MELNIFEAIGLIIVILILFMFLLHVVGYLSELICNAIEKAFNIFLDTKCFYMTFVLLLLAFCILLLVTCAFMTDTYTITL